MTTRPRRVLALFAVGLALGCRGPAAVELVPEGATLLATIDVKGLIGAPVFQHAREKVDQAGDLKAALDGLAACNVDPTGLGTMVVGSDDESENLVVIFEAAGLGIPANLECLGKKIEAATGELPWTTAQQEGRTILNVRFGKTEGVAYMIGNDKVALTSGAWAEAVRNRIEGKGEAAIMGTLKPMYDRVDRSRQAWFVGLVSPKVSESLTGTPGEAVRDISGTLDLAQGIEITVTANVDTEANAAVVVDKGTAQIGSLKTAAPILGLPPTLVDGVSIVAEGTSVKLRAFVSTADVMTVADTIRQRRDGAPGAAAQGVPSGAEPAKVAAPQAAPVQLDPAAR